MRKLLILILAFYFIGCSKKITRIEEPVIVKKSIPIQEVKEIESVEFVETVEPKVYGNILHVHFDFDKYDINEQALNELHNNINVLMEMYNDKQIDKIIIEGHCDERGSCEYNLALGERRANTIKNYLSNAGYGKKLIEIISYGEERPVDKMHNENAWQQNRRAETKID